MSMVRTLNCFRVAGTAHINFLKNRLDKYVRNGLGIVLLLIRQEKNVIPKFH